MNPPTTPTTSEKGVRTCRPGAAGQPADGDVRAPFSNHDTLPPAANQLPVGIGEVEITPPFPHPMAGFGKARTANHTGVHDPIFARTVIFGEGSNSVALVSCEVIGLKATVIESIRSAIPDAWGISAERVVICCTHTHGAPVINADYIPFLSERIVESIGKAVEDRTPRFLATGRAKHMEWTGFNRRRLETGFLPVDREVLTLSVHEPDGKVRAVLFHYACHPSILGPDNLLITADWPGYAGAFLKAELGDAITPIFLQGAEGDINTGYSAGVSSLGVKIPTRTYETAGRVGEIVGRCAVDAVGSSDWIVPEIRFASRKRDLAYRSTEGLETLRAKHVMWAARIESLCTEGASSDLILHARVQHAYAGFEVSAVESVIASKKADVSAEQTVFRIGKVGFVSLPGEFFVEDGLRIKRESSASVTFPLGMCGDYLGYFPTADSFTDGGYEVACADFAPETASTWCSDSLKILNTFFSQP